MLVVARTRDNRRRRPVNYRLPEDLLEQLDKLTDETRRTATAEVELALEAHLKKNKLWPPPKKEKDKDE